MLSGRSKDRGGLCFSPPSWVTRLAGAPYRALVSALKRGYFLFLVNDIFLSSYTVILHIYFLFLHFVEGCILTRFNSLKPSAILATSTVIWPVSSTFSLYMPSIFLHFTQMPSEKKSQMLLRYVDFHENIN